MLLTNKVEDPLKNFQALQVTDIATALYALKIANDQYYAVIHMREQMEMELARSKKEIDALSLKIVQQFLTEPAYNIETHVYSDVRPISYVPDPLPEPPKLPQWAYDAVKHLQGQLTVERQRAEAELADNAEDINEMREYLEGLVKEWFIAEVQAAPDWLCGSKSIILGGCTVTYENGDVTFSYAELDYGD